MNMIVSGISVKDGEKIAYVRFEEADSFAECTIPDCVIREHKGFTEDELSQIEQYLRMNLLDLKKQAVSINPIKAMMKEE